MILQLLVVFSIYIINIKLLFNMESSDNSFFLILTSSSSSGMISEFIRLFKEVEVTA